MRKVIVNSTPLIALCKVDQLDLLRKLYREISIPEAVFVEVSRKNDIVKQTIEACPWIHREMISNSISKRMYRAKLHDGEDAPTLCSFFHRSLSIFAIHSFS